MRENLKKRLLRTAILSALALVIGAGIGFMQVRTQSAQLIQKPGTDTGVAGVKVGGPFTLVDHNGKTVTEKDFAGQYKLIYFGFTYCPAICPTELQKIARVMNGLGDHGKDIQPLFITIDPERDTPEVLKDYAAMFHPRLTGLTGNLQQIEEVKKNYRIYAAKAPLEGGDYTIDHSSFIYLMNPQDEMIALYRTADTADFIAKDITARMTEK